MKTYVAILRGVNVSGKNMIKMAALTKSLESAGYEHVKTYIQSGNIVFQAPGKDVESIAKVISEIIVKDFEASVRTLVIAAEYLQKVIANNPFLNRESVDSTKLHVTFLADIPDSEKTKLIDAEKYLPDEFSIYGDCIYLYCPNGYGLTKLSNNFFESKLKLVATTRNWATVNRLSEMAQELENDNQK